MKVLYDISVLGMGHFSPTSRTGVFRVIESVAKQLAINPQCDVTFCNSKYQETIGLSLDYLKNTESFSKVPFSKPVFYDRLLAIGIKKSELIKQVVAEEPLSLFKKLQAKLQIKEFLVFERFCKIYNNELIHPRDRRKADIFHSPFYALPEKDVSKVYKGVFLTCYDLIPILYPQYFEQGIIDLTKAIFKNIDKETWILCISESTRNDLLNYLGSKINPDRVIVTELAASETFYPSIDKERNLKIRKKHNIPESPYILSLCTFEPRKNITQVVRAFAKIISQQKEITDLNLVLVGSKGWLYEKIFNEIENSEEVKNRIIVTGFVDDDELAAIYSDAQLFVYPSFYEGFGLPPLEAMKCGTPVITSNTSSLPEVVGNAGIMVSPTDLDGLCQAIFSVYNNPELRQRMASQSLERAGHFSWERCGNETVNAYAASLVR